MELNPVGFNDESLPKENTDSGLSFYPKHCFDQVRANVEDFDNIYCGGGTIIMVLS